MLKSSLLSAGHPASWAELQSYPKEEPFLLNKGSSEQGPGWPPETYSGSEGQTQGETSFQHQVFLLYLAS